MKTTSCGILIFNNDDKILLGHATGQRHWDIPKGMNDNGESHIETAIRETKEETGIEIKNSKDLEFIGTFNYNKKKDLALFKYKIKNIDLTQLKCESLFENRYTKEMIPEIDEFKLVSMEEGLTMVCESMKKVLSSIKN